MSSLASFPNSRVLPRPATKNSINGPDTNVLAQDAGTGPNNTTEIRPANDNRTLTTIVNVGVNDMRFNRDGAAIDFATKTGTLLLAGAALDVEGPEAIYGACNIGLSTYITWDEGEG